MSESSDTDARQPDFIAGPHLSHWDKWGLFALAAALISAVLGAYPFFLPISLVLVFLFLIVLNGGPSIQIWENRLVFTGYPSIRKVVFLDEVTHVVGALGHRSGWCLYLMSGDRKLAVLGLVGIANSGPEAQELACRLNAYLGVGDDDGMAKVTREMSRKLIRLSFVTFLFVLVIVGGMAIIIFNGLLHG